MKLFKFSVYCLGAQVLLAYLMLNLFGVSGAFFYVAMMISAHMIMEAVAKSSLDVDHGLMTLVIVYFTGEAYLGILAIATVTGGAESPIYQAMYHSGPAVMLCLTLLSLVTGALTPILHNTGKFGDVIGRFISASYNGVVSLPLHRSGN